MEQNEDALEYSSEDEKKDMLEDNLNKLKVLCNPFVCMLVGCFTLMVGWLVGYLIDWFID